MKYESLAARLEANSIRGECGCRLWTGRLNNAGYPVFTKRVAHKPHPVPHYAHRAAFEIEYEVAIPRGLELDHLCVTPNCIEPSHLEPVTTAENLRRRDARRAAAH